MLKVKLINEKTPLKIKMVAKFPSVVLANLQDKETTPTKELQVVVADENYDGLSKVIVNPIPNEYIIPSGELEIIQNGTYNVVNKASAKVNVPMPTGTIDIIENGLHNVKDKEFANVNVPEKQLGTKTITKNGTYKAIDDGLDGYSEVEVSTSGVDINEYYNLTKRTSGYITFYIKQIPLIDTSGYTSMSYMFSNYASLTTIPQLVTNNVTAFQYMFQRCEKLNNVPELNAEKANNVSNCFSGCVKLENFGGFKDLGKAYDTSKSANYSYYTLALSYSANLTHDSLMNVINNLYDIASIGVQPQQLVLGSTNLAKLTDEEIAIASNKGWTIS